MRRKVTISLLTIFLSASIDTVFALEAKTLRRIGWLGLTIPARYEAFRQGMRDLGYIEGQTFVIERVDTGANRRLADASAELLRRKVEVIVTTGSPAVFAAKQATSIIPIVMTTGGDPVVLGLIASLARPGGNVTGLTSISNDLAGKRLELLKETIPKLVRIGVLWNPDDPPRPSISFKETEDAARGFGMQVQPLGVRSPNDIGGAFKTATAKRIEALVILQTALINNQRIRIIELATENRLPTMFGEGLQVESGGLMSYAPNSPDLFRRAAIYVDKILKGAKPAELPVEQPMKFEFIINLKTAKQIGLIIPPNVLARADKVIR